MSLSSELENDPPMRTYDRPNTGRVAQNSEGGDDEAEFSRRLDQVREENLVATGALIRCQGLLSSFNRPDVRKAFLDGKFVSGDCKAMLDSIDIIRDITLPHPFLSSGLPLVASDALDFVSKLLSKQESEPLDGLQRHLPHRQSFGQWRELFSELQRQPIWRYFNDYLQVVDRPSSSRQNSAENLKRERQAKFRSAGVSYRRTPQMMMGGQHLVIHGKADTQENAIRLQSSGIALQTRRLAPVMILHLKVVNGGGRNMAQGMNWWMRWSSWDSQRK